MQKKICETTSFKEDYTMLNDIPLHRLYHINSELNGTNSYSFIREIDSRVTHPEFIKKVEEQYERHCECIGIELPKVSKNIKGRDILSLLKSRRTIRNFEGTAIDVQNLSDLLHYSCGVSGVYRKFKSMPEMKLFTYPNAGSIYCIYAYISVQNVNGLKNGFYYYDPILHSLKEIKKYKREDDYYKYSMQYELLSKSSFSVYLVGSLEILGLKYGNRGYRFMLQNAGHAAQNFLLIAENYKLGAVASGGFLDAEIRRDLKLENEFVLYEIVFGKPNLIVKDNRFV